MDPPPKRVAFQEASGKASDDERGSQTDDEDDEGGRADWRTKTTGKERKFRFTYWNEIVIWASVVFYLADLGLDWWVTAEHFKVGKWQSGWFIFFCILLPNLYAGYKSLQWYLRAHAENPIRQPIIWVIRVLFFPLSLLLRYWDAWRYGRQSRIAFKNSDYRQEKALFSSCMVESAEVAMLRLFIIFLEDAPIAVLNLKELLQVPPQLLVYKLDIACVVLAKLVCTMTLGVVHYTSSNKLAWHAAKSTQSFLKGHAGYKKKVEASWQKKGNLSWAAQLTIYCWQLLCIASRLMAYAMFAAVYPAYMWIPIFLRWFIHTVWIYCDVRDMSLMNAIAFGGVYLFSFTATSPNRQILRIIFYFIIVFAENIIIAVLWTHAAPDNPYRLGAILFVFCGAGAGIVFMVLYYAIFHPSSADTWLRNWYRNRRKSPVSREI